MFYRKAQAAVELMIILAAALVVLIAILSLSNQSIQDLNKEKLIETANNSVGTLKDAVNDVYSQGVGAKKQVFFVVPKGVDSASSGINSNTIVLNLLGSDVYSKANVTLSGEIPTTPGGHWVWVTAFENYVAVGVQNISIDKTSSFVTLSQSDSAQDTFTISNDGVETATITITENWAPSDVTLLVSDNSFSLNPGQQQIITLTYDSTPVAAGNYTGSLDITANFPSLTENISFPLNAEVVVAGSEESDLIVLPLTYYVSLDQGNFDNSSFQVCNNSTGTLNNIYFSKTGSVAPWITPEPIPEIALLDAGECQGVNFTVTVPPAQAEGTYLGSIVATDGTGLNSDSIALTVDTVEIPIMLETVNILIFSDPSYSTPATSFLQGETVYYEVYTFDQSAAPLDVTDLNITITDSLSVIRDSLIGLSTSLGKYQGSYTTLLTADTGTWVIQADANKNNWVSDTSNFDVTPIVECPTQALCFNQAWNSSEMACKAGGAAGRRYCQLALRDPFWSIENTSGSTILTVARIRISWSGDTDGDTTVDEITINDIQRNSSSSASGVWNNITDFSLTGGEIISSDNWFKWVGSTDSGLLNNETETYTIDFEFSDASIYTTTGYNPP